MIFFLSLHHCSCRGILLSETATRRGFLIQTISGCSDRDSFPFQTVAFGCASCQSLRIGQTTRQDYISLGSVGSQYTVTKRTACHSVTRLLLLSFAQCPPLPRFSASSWRASLAWEVFQSHWALSGLLVFPLSLPAHLFHFVCYSESAVSASRSPNNSLDSNLYWFLLVLLALGHIFRRDPCYSFRSLKASWGVFSFSLHRSFCCSFLMSMVRWMTTVTTEFMTYLYVLRTSSSRFSSRWRPFSWMLSWRRIAGNVYVRNIYHSIPIIRSFMFDNHHGTMKVVPWF